MSEESSTRAGRLLRRVLSFEVIFAVAALALVAWLLFVPPTVGLADNGDFARAMVFFDLAHKPNEWGERYFAYVNTSYVFDRTEARRYASPDFPSSELIFVAAAVAVNRLAGASTFDLRVLGALHTVAFAIAVFLLLKAVPRKRPAVVLIAAVLGLVVFTDVAYVAYFNSFYSEAASLIFLVLLIAAGYHAGAHGWGLSSVVLYTAAAIAFVLSKYQNLVLLPLLLLFAAFMVRGRSQKEVAGYLAVALLACFGAYRWFMLSPAAVDEAVLYNSVFNGILVDSPTPREDLIALGLNPELARHAGTTAFQPESPRFDATLMSDFRRNVTVGRIAAFYVSHPLRLAAALNRTVARSFDTRPPQLGNLPRDAGRPEGASSGAWAMWSTFRAAALPRSLWFVFLVAATHLFFVLKAWSRVTDATDRSRLAWTSLLPVLAIAQLVLITASDGVSDLVKHAYLFNLLFDAMLVAIAARGIVWFMRPSERRQAALAKESGV